MASTIEQWATSLFLPASADAMLHPPCNLWYPVHRPQRLLAFDIRPTTDLASSPSSCECAGITLIVTAADSEVNHVLLTAELLLAEVSKPESISVRILPLTTQGAWHIEIYFKSASWTWNTRRPPTLCHEPPRAQG